MSIVIYNGKRIQASPVQAFRRLQSLRPKIEQNIRGIVREGFENHLFAMANETAAALNEGLLPDIAEYLPPNKREEKNVQKFIHRLADEPGFAATTLFFDWAYYAQHARNCCAVPPEFDIYLALSVSFTHKAAYCIPVCSNPELEHGFDGIDWLEDYSYWDNMNIPAGISQQEWRSRRKAWNKAFPSGSVTRDGMLIVYSSIDQSWPYGITFSKTDFDRAIPTVRPKILKQSFLDIETNKAMMQLAEKDRTTAQAMHILRTLRDALDANDSDILARYEAFGDICPKDYDECKAVFARLEAAASKCGPDCHPKH